MHDDVIDPEFGLDTLAEDGRALVRVRGEIDLATAPALRQAVQELFDGPLTPGLITLDLSAVSVIDSTGLSMVVALHQQARSRGAELVVGSPSSSVLRILELTGLRSIIPVEDVVQH